MVVPFHQTINRLIARFRRPPTPPPAVSESPCPLAQPDAVLPAWVADDPVVLKYRALLGDLPWGQFPERPADRPYPGPTPQPRVSFAAAYLVKLQEDKRFMSDLRTYLIEHPALVYWLGFARVPDPSAPHGFDVAASVPNRRQLSSVLRHLPNPALQFLLSASIDLLKATLPPDQQATFGDIIAGDTQAILAWVKENNPKQFIKEGRLDKTRQPAGDPDCKLGVKKRRNAAVEDATGHDHPAPTSDAKPATKLQVGVDILWGYASGIVVTRLPDGTEVVLAERTRPFNEDDITHFFPLMAQVEARLGRRPRFGTWDAAYDAHYVYDYFDQAGGVAAVPFNGGGQRAKRTFAPDGSPLCAAGLSMHLQFTYQHRVGLVPHERAKYTCPLLQPTVTGEPCPCADPHFAKGGCSSTIANTKGARIRHELDREDDDYKRLYALRTMVERINSQAEALDILRPKLRRGRAIVNANTLRYTLLNVRALLRVRAAAAAEEGQLTQS
ncbi:transposase [Oscillochloris sp. ZM17-4]|uniref:transposase n=1 Tax=Oscillochloris sp. ZM17-4 TaxID=2866714 RepID=UPI001C731DF7|nr:transposase [Oscillochloris sp. ZM17-4]MBX0329707.1 transposase [Oscillochloris sp. ZM17-4]